MRSITDVGDGMLEGAGAIGSSVLRGFRGLFEKPLQGAQQEGVHGACLRGQAPPAQDASREPARENLAAWPRLLLRW